MLVIFRAGIVSGVIPPFADQPVFAERTALYRGDAVAAIVGDAATVAAFDEADFPISWEPLETMLTPDAALVATAPRLHESRAGNILVRGYVECGDADSALAGAAHRVEIETSTPFVEHAYIEPEAGYAQREGNRLVVYGCTQAAQMDRESLADILGLDLDAIRVIRQPVVVGSGQSWTSRFSLMWPWRRGFWGGQHVFATVVANR